MRQGFAPSWSITVVALLSCALFIRLGLWQWDRGNARAAQWAKFARGADKVEALGARGLDEVPRFQRVSLVGRFDPDHQFLLDNRTYDGRAGYEVLTPLERQDGGRIALVDRGWVPFSGSRNNLPAVTLETRATVTVMGRADDLPTPGLAAGRAAPSTDSHWPKVTSYPTTGQLSAALARPVESRIVLLDPQAPDGYVRDWHPPGMQPLRHWSYAVQWWCFAVVTLIFWTILSRRRTSSPP